ncbi:MAG: DnaJ domain-containing protein [Myxococcota bacterium]
MAFRILVVDDEASIRRLLSESFRKAGWAPLVAEDQTSAQSLLATQIIDAALIDFLLPKGNGLQIAASLRGDPRHRNIPIFLMSGVIRDAATMADARSRYDIAGFISKPLEISALIKRVSDAVEESRRIISNSMDLERVRSDPPPSAPIQRPDARTEPKTWSSSPFQPIPETGSLFDAPVGLLFSAILQASSTGILDLHDQGTHRRIYLREGRPVFMQSNAEGENVGSLLSRRGRLTEQELDRCLDLMRNQGRTLQQALLQLKMVSESDLATAYRLLAGQTLPVAVGMGKGTFRWRETDAFVGRVPEGRFDPVMLVFDGVKRYVQPPEIFRFFAGIEDNPLIATDYLEERLPQFRRVFSADNIAALIDGTRSYRDICRHGDLQRFAPQVFAMVVSGMVVFGELGPEEIRLARAMAAFEEDAPHRSHIDEVHEQIMSQNFYEIFRVSSSAHEEMIKSRYFQLAKDWHPTSHRDLDPRRQQMVSEIFERITSAYETLSKPTERSAYDEYLDRSVQGLPTDPNTINRSEQLFEQGHAMAGRSDWSGADRVLAEAVRLNPEPRFIALQGWVQYQRAPSHAPNVERAKGLLKRSLKNGPMCEAYVYLGRICGREGRRQEAIMWWELCLKLKPNHPEARKEVENLRSQGTGGQ